LRLTIHGAVIFSVISERAGFIVLNINHGSLISSSREDNTEAQSLAEKSK
jgi:hypothetical protein